LFAGEGDGRLVASSAPILQKYSLSEFDIKVESDKFLPLYTRLEIDDWVWLLFAFSLKFPILFIFFYSSLRLFFLLRKHLEWNDILASFINLL